MMNLLPSGDRNKEMSELLFRNYKTGIVFSTDSVSVDFYENRPIAITIDMLLAGDVREPYGAVYEAAMQAAAGGRTVRRSGIPEPDPEPVDRRRPEEVGRRGEYGAEV